MEFDKQKSKFKKSLVYGYQVNKITQYILYKLVKKERKLRKDVSRNFIFRKHEKSYCLRLFEK